ncbi:hypothetical protein VTK26DRAFT_1074 [Humicola hyalothermophila]
MTAPQCAMYTKRAAQLHIHPSPQRVTYPFYYQGYYGISCLPFICPSAIICFPWCYWCSNGIAEGREERSWPECCILALISTRLSSMPSRKRCRGWFSSGLYVLRPRHAGWDGTGGHLLRFCRFIAMLFGVIGERRRQFGMRAGGHRGILCLP